MVNRNIRILCTTDGTFRVQRLTEGDPSGRWATVHICKSKHEAGYNEARQWIEKEASK